MKQTFTRYYADSTCPYTIDGVHLTSLRRAKLGPLAESLKVDPLLPKNEIITQLIAVLQKMEAPLEIGDLVKPKKKAGKKK